MSVIFRSRTAVLAIALFCLISLPSKSQGKATSLAVFAAECASHFGVKLPASDFKVVEAQKTYDSLPKFIATLDEPDAENKLWIADLGQTYQTQIRVNKSLEYVPHRVYEDVHTFIDKTILDKEAQFLKLVEQGSVTKRFEKRVKNFISKLKAESQEFKSGPVHQIDFLFFTRNATRLFDLVDKDGNLSGKAADLAVDWFDELYYDGKRDMDYKTWRRLSTETLLIPTEKTLSPEDFVVGSPYPIYFFAVTPNGGIADGRIHNAEQLLLHDILHNSYTNSRFDEIKETASRKLSESEIALLREKD